MDYSQASVKVVIDFIKFRISTPDGPIERTEHDITARNLEARIKRLKVRYGAVSDPVPIGLEVAMDVFDPGDDLDTLAEITADLWRLNIANLSPNQRIYRSRQEGRPTTPPTDRTKLATKLRAGYQLAEGNQNDPIYRHAYLKLADDAGRINLRPCARLEFRLQGDTCPFDTLDGLRNFDWRELRHWFRFRELRDDLGKLETVIANNSDHIGKRQPRARVSQPEMRAKGVREFSRLTVSNQTLNRKADASLASLERSWKRLSAAVEMNDLPGNLEQFSPGSRASNGIRSITTLANLDSLANQPHPPAQASEASAARLYSTPRQSIEASLPSQATDGAMRPLPASPSPSAPAIPVTSTTHDNVIKSVPTEPRRGDGWQYPDEPW